MEDFSRSTKCASAYRSPYDIQQQVHDLFKGYLLVHVWEYKYKLQNLKLFAR